MPRSRGTEARTWNSPKGRARIGAALLIVLSTLAVVMATHDPFSAASGSADGYWMVGADGGAFSFGGAAFEGSAATTPLRAPIVGMAATTDGRGYWLVGSDGGVFSYGDAVFHGSAAGVDKHAPIVGIASDPAGPGYWLVGADGGVFSFGDAAFYGSAAGVHLNRPIVGMAATPDGRGYWLVGADGGVFNYGDARFLGSAEGMPLNRPIVGMAATTDGGGYWLAAGDGGVFTFGDAPFYGSSAHAGIDDDIVGIVPSTSNAIAGGNAFCGNRGGPPTTRKLLVIYEENANYDQVIGGSQTPNFNTYAQDCGLATDFNSLTHPSLPNYLESTSGVDYATTPWTNDCEASASGCNTNRPSIFSQISNWKGYAETMPSNCDTSADGEYYVRHNPEPYYTNVRAECDTNDVPLGTLTSGALHTDVVDGTLPTFSTVTPNGDDDGHDTSPHAADTWIGPWIDQITQGPDYQSGNLTIEIVWDEGQGSGTVSSHIAAIFLSPFIKPGTQSATSFTAYSTLRAAEEIAGVPLLANAASANDLRSAFGF